MKFSLIQLRYINNAYESAGDPAAEGVENLLEKIGAQLGGVEEVTYLGDKYKDTLIVKVVECEPHPDSDHMHICMIDDGGKTEVEHDDKGLVQVVCGAPNVKAGMTVVWLPPGATVPDSYGTDEPFVLGARELRGVISNGMLASARELGLGDNHDGILEITDTDVEPGTPFGDKFELTNDVIIDIENKMFTHRPDCFGYIGIARELAGIRGEQYTSPEWYRADVSLPAPESEVLPFAFHNELPELVPRFTAVVISGVEIKQSPSWLQVSLSRVGSRPINNIVDYTNFFMLETGQPLHAYDYDKVKALSGDAATIVVRNPKPGERLTLLNGKTIEPRAEAIMIATDKGLIGLAGVMGGADTEVDENTKNIILESANFDMYSIRRTSMTHGLFTDAVTRFNKGQSPLQNLAVLAKITDEIRQFADGKVASEVIDDNRLAGREWVHPPVPLTTEYVNVRLGLELSADEMRTLLTNVEFEVSNEGDTLNITAPFWRTDIESREDVVEEIGRLYGFDKLPLELPYRDIKPADKDALFELKASVREKLSRAGANEVLTYSFVHSDLLQKVGQNPEDAFKVGNALSPELQYYRLSLTPSLLEKIHPNIKAGYDEFAVFEIGKGHNLQHADDDDGLPMEFEMLDLVYAATEKAGKAGAAFFEARKFLVTLLAELGIQIELRSIQAEEDYPVVKPYDHTRSAQVFVKGTGLPLGMIGEYKQSVRKALKLPKYSAGFGVGLAQLQQALGHVGNSYVPLPRFPKVSQDITLKVPAELGYQELYDFVWDELAKLQPEQTLPSLGPIDIYQREDDTSNKQMTFRFSIANYQRTMADTEVTKMLDTVAAAANEMFGAERI